MNQEESFKAISKLRLLLEDMRYSDFVVKSITSDTYENIENEIKTLINFVDEQQEKIIELEGFCSSLSEQIEEFEYKEDEE